RVSGGGRDGPVGRSLGGRRHTHQHGKSFGKPEAWIKPYGTRGEQKYPRGTATARGSTHAHSSKAPELPGTSLGLPEMPFLRQKVAKLAVRQQKYILPPEA